MNNDKWRIMNLRIILLFTLVTHKITENTPNKKAFFFVTWNNQVQLYLIAGCELTMFFFSDKGLSFLLKTQTDLELLHLKLGSVHVHFSDKCLAMLRSPKLMSVKLEGLDQLTNHAIITLAKNCPNICELMLPRCSELTDGCIQTITTLLNGKLVSGGHLTIPCKQRVK